MTKRILTLAAAVGLITLSLGQACSDIGATSFDSTLTDASAMPFTLSPASAAVAPGATVQFAPVGGVAPFNYSINNGGGTISQTGLFTAPLSTTNGGSVTIVATDSLGTQSYATVSVNGNIINASFTPNPAAPSSAITINVLGGTPPYTFQLGAGQGSLANNVYVAPATSETAVINIADSQGLTTSLTIPIGTAAGGTGMGIMQLSMSLSGQHIPNGPGCPIGYTLSGMVADATYNPATNSPYIYGDIDICMQMGSIGTGAPYVSDLYVSGGGCNSGYQAVGGYPNCSSGICWGNYSICAQFATSGAAPVQDFYITQENIHNPSGPYCNAGYTSAGQVPDCGYGTCSGLQTLCIRR